MPSSFEYLNRLNAADNSNIVVINSFNASSTIKTLSERVEKVSEFSLMISVAVLTDCPSKLNVPLEKPVCNSTMRKIKLIVSINSCDRNVGTNSLIKGSSDFNR